MSGELFNAGTLVDRNLEAGRGAKTAIRCAGEELTYAQLHDRICRMGNALRELGVGREDRVLMILDDTPAFPTVFLGAMRIGAVPVPVSFLDTLIENVLVEHPRVLEAAAVGVDHEYTTRVKAYVICRGDAGDDGLVAELQEWCKSRLRRYEYPHFIDFVDELPKTPTGKIQRYKLRERG